jgi:hypothetical protein
MPMRQALDAWRAGGAGSLYQEVFFIKHIKFQYPPTSLLPLLGLQALGINTTDIFLNDVNRVLVVVNALGVGWLFWLVLVRTQDNRAAASPTGIAGAVLVSAAALVFYPVIMGFWLGQIQIWIDTGFTFACIALLYNRDVEAGVAIGLICLLKPQFAVFAVWAVLRRRWHFLLGGTFALVPCGLLSLALFGLQTHLDYLRELSFISRHGEALIVNNSANGILNDVLGTANRLVWDGMGFPPYNPVVHLGTVAATIILILGALWPWRKATLNGVMDFQFAALAFTMASPIAWEHHYGVVAPILATIFCLVAATSDSSQRKWQLIALAGLYVLSATCVTSNLYKIPTTLNWALGYLFFAGIGVLAMLRWVGRFEQIDGGREAA